MKLIFFIVLLVSLSLLGCTSKKTGADKVVVGNSNNGPATTEMPFEVYQKMETKMYKAINTNDLEVIDKLLEEGIDINYQESMGGFSLLTHAIFYEHIESARYLVEKGADVNVSTFKGSSPLMMAIQVLNLDLVKLLISKGANINAKDSDGRPVLFYAIYQNGAEGIFKFLIQQKVDVNVKFSLKNLPDETDNGVDISLLEYAKGNKKKEIIDLLIKAGAKE